MKRLCIVHNPSAGSADSERAISDAFAPFDVELVFVVVTRALTRQLEAVVADGVDTVVAAGGDGTVNAVAQFAVEHRLTLAVLPLGTLNHFAKDIGMPLDLAEAAAVIAAGHTQALDYATVNDNVYLNNSSLGVYPDLVRGRERLPNRLGKWPAAAVAWFQVAKNMAVQHLTVTVGHQEYSLRSPLVFIGNNDYHLEQTGLSNRTNLADGKLCIYIIRANTLRSFLRMGFLMFWGKTLKNKDFIETQTTACSVNSSRRRVYVSLDGEVRRLQTPLRYAIHPAGIHVCVPTP